MKTILKFIKSVEIADQTKAFFFEKPGGFEYIPGQNADLTITKNLNKDDSRGPSRTFSFITIPDDNIIGFATRMTGSGFKETLDNLEPGEEAVELDGPYGDYTLHKNDKKEAIFIQGGIGVTPVHSIIKYATEENLPHKIILFHANSELKNAPAQNDFIDWEDKNPNFTFVQVLGKGDGNAKNVESGKMNSEIFKKYADINDNSIYYLSGPEGMVKAMKTMLVDELGADEDNIRTEEFPGY